jgi:hypothetical protein
VKPLNHWLLPPAKQLPFFLEADAEGHITGREWRPPPRERKRIDIAAGAAIAVAWVLVSLSLWLFVHGAVRAFFY